MIETALGQVERDALGVVSMHEHLRADASALHRPGIEDLDPDASVTVELAGSLRWGQLAVRDNLRVDDDSAVAHELEAARGRGLRTVVDATSLGLNPGYDHLPAISRASGVTVVACFGAYLGSAIPSWYRDLDTAGREDLFFTALTDAIPGVDFRAGMLGIMGTTADFDADERSSLTAAASAAARAGASVSIRLDPDARNGLEIIDHCASAGLAPENIVLTNVDEYLDGAYLNDLADAGAVLEICFGGEGGHVGRVRNSADFDRLDALLRLIARDRATRLVLGCSTWTKAQWSRFGGPGYGHLVTRVVPALRYSGVDDVTLDRMLIHEPVRILDRPAAD